LGINFQSDFIFFVALSVGIRAVPKWHTTGWHIAEVAAFQHFINASNDGKNTQNLSTRGKAAILAICSLGAGDFQAIKSKMTNVIV
jgi:hypothetical protein